MSAAVRFRFDAGAHDYIALDTGETLPHITGMLDYAGLVDDLWFTEESSHRGTCIHKMTADFDLGAITDPESVTSIHKNYFLAYVAALKALRPEILEVEVPIVHPVHRYGGRPDRIVKLHGRRGVLEIKTTAAPAESHRVQTALQTILDASRCAIQAEDLGRWCLYLKPTGRFKLEDHTAEPWKHARDFRRAREVIRTVCGPARPAGGIRPLTAADAGGPL